MNAIMQQALSLSAAESTRQQAVALIYPAIMEGKIPGEDRAKAAVILVRRFKQLMSQNFNQAVSQKCRTILNLYLQLPLENNDEKIHFTFIKLATDLAAEDTEFNFPIFLQLLGERYGAVVFAEKETMKRVLLQLLLSQYDIDIKQLLRSSGILEKNVPGYITQIRDNAYWVILDVAQNEDFSKLWYIFTRYQELLCCFPYDNHHGEVLELASILMSKYGKWRFEHFLNAWGKCMETTTPGSRPKVVAKVIEIYESIPSIKEISIPLLKFVEENKQYKNQQILITDDTTYQVNAAVDIIEMRENFDFKVTAMDSRLNKHVFNYKPGDGGATLKSGNIVTLTYKKESDDESSTGRLTAVRATKAPLWSIFKRIFLTIEEPLNPSEITLGNAEKGIYFSLTNDAFKELSSKSGADIATAPGTKIKAVITTKTVPSTIIRLFPAGTVLEP